MGDLRPRSVGTPVASLRGPLGDFLSEVSLAPLLKQPGRRSYAAAGLQALQSGSALGAQRDPGRGRGGSPDGKATRQNPTGEPPKPRGAGQPPRPRSSPAACPASGGFSASSCKIPRWNPARRSGAADWTGGVGGSSPHRRFLSFLGRYLPRRQARARRSFSASLPRLLPQELNGLEKATCELHLFSLRVDNSIYSVIFRNVYNYGMRHAANCMHFRSEMRVIRASRARGDLCCLS